MAYNPEVLSCPRCGARMIGHSFRGGTNWRCSRNPLCDGFVSHIKQKKQTKEQKIKKIEIKKTLTKTEKLEKLRQNSPK